MKIFLSLYRCYVPEKIDDRRPGSSLKQGVLLRAWILCCAGLVALGWILSLFGALTLTSYGIAFVLAVAVAIYFPGWRPARLHPPRRFLPRIGTSISLLLPALFAFSAVALFIKGIALPPYHDDGLCYRIPRALNWIMDHRWHWIDAVDPRLDVLGSVSEWLSVPILMLTRSDRFVFLPNWICYLLLPGLIFSVWRNLGVSSKISWLCMWLMPTGFCFALQAVNTSNDSLAAFFVLAAFYFALNGSRTHAWSDFAFSILCIALATGVKLNQLPFLLAWVVALSAGWRILLARPGLTLAVCLWAALISFLPNCYFNYVHGRGWTGLEYVQPPPPLINYICTSYRIIIHNLMPPLFAFSSYGRPLLLDIEHSMMGDLLRHYYHEARPIFYVQVAVQQAGIGFLVTLLLVLFILLTRAAHTKTPRLFSSAFMTRRTLIFFGVGIAFLHYLLFVSSDQPARLICTFYLLLTPAFFSRRPLRDWVPWHILRLFTGMAMLLGTCTMFFLAENPPLCLFHVLEERRLDDIEVKTGVDALLPPGEKEVGIIRYWNQRESWLWEPYGSRKVIELPALPTPAVARARELGLRYLVISNKALHDNHLSIDFWLTGQPARVIGSAQADAVDIGWYTVDKGWYVVKLEP